MVHPSVLCEFFGEEIACVVCIFAHENKLISDQIT